MCRLVYYIYTEGVKMDYNNEIQSDDVNTCESFQDLQEVKKTLEDSGKQLENWRKMQIEAFKRFKSRIEIPSFG